MRDHNEIIKAAYRAMKANQRGMRGQTMDPQDSIEWWVADTALEGPCKACESTAKANDYLKKQCDYKDDIINQLTDERAQYLRENKALHEEITSLKQSLKEIGDLLGLSTKDSHNESM